MAIDKNSKIYVAGHRGMVGSAIVRKLKALGFTNLVMKNRRELDLINQQSVENFFKIEKPEYVFICAAKVGGINANNIYRAEFIYENIQIQNNLIHFSHISRVKKLIFMGSSCIYPRNCPQPIKEEYLLTDILENTNEPYAIAKIAGIKMCENYYKQYGDLFFSIMPTNTYGPKDNYDLESSHVLPALLRKFHEAKIQKKNEVMIWGSGKPLREFIYVDDIADAAIFTMNLDFKELYKAGLSHLNVGSSIEVSIYDLAKLISNEIEYSGKIKFNPSKPDGTPRKIMDSSRLNNLGWKNFFSLKEGVKMTYSFFKDEYAAKWANDQ